MDFSALIGEQFCVLDGGMGTLLQREGLAAGDLPERWNIDRPDLVKSVHQSYLEAGAQVVTTNTFGGSPIKLEMSGSTELMEGVNREGARLAREAVDGFGEDCRFVAGSIGPSGKMIGLDVSEGEAGDSFMCQARCLADGGVDLFLVETMMNLDEAVVAVETLKSGFTRPVAASLVFTRTPRGEFRTLYGNEPAEAADRLIGAGADAVGTNCGLIEDYVEVIRVMRSRTGAPLLCYPNAGMPHLRDGETVYDATPESLIGSLDDLIDAGATIIGGCCGTTPEYTRLLAERIAHRKIQR